MRRQYNSMLDQFGRDSLSRRDRGGPLSRASAPHADLSQDMRFATGSCEIDRVQLAGIPHEESAMPGHHATPVTAVTAIPHAVFVFDTDGRITDVNPLAEALVGYAYGDLVGKRIGNVISAGRSALDARDRARFVSPRDGVHAHHRNGLKVAIEILLCPYDRQSTMAIVSMPGGRARDCIRGEDVVQIVHDLKGPLATIALETSVLDAKLNDAKLNDAKLNDSHPVDVSSAVTRINRNVFYLDRMVHDLLDSCSIDAGRFEIHRRSTELRALLEQMVERVVSTQDRGRVLLETPRPYAVVIDDLRIERVAANLLQNALKYAPRDSEVVIRLEVKPEGGCRISVIDAGPGLTEAEIGYVFDRYRRTSGALGHEGSGLGLFVSKQIVEAHGGTMGVHSVHGTGSRFFFDLPMT
jgi:PAS domain S-box-containing protein